VPVIKILVYVRIMHIYENLASNLSRRAGRQAA